MRLARRVISDRRVGPIAFLKPMKCPYCKGQMREELLDYIVEREDGQHLRLEEVPTWFCEKCDYTEVEEEVGEAIEDMLSHLDTVQRGGEEE